jgi:hypothetical protein
MEEKGRGCVTEFGDTRKSSQYISAEESVAAVEKKSVVSVVRPLN